jgi:hypothetical protein
MLQQGYIAFHLFSFGNALMGEETFHNCKIKCPNRPHYQPEMRGRTLSGVVKLLLQLSDENNSKIESIDLSSFKMQFLSHCYGSQVAISEDDS